MSCEHPYKAFYTGNKTDNGKDEFCLIRDSSSGDLNVDIARRKGYKVDVTKKDFVRFERGYFYLYKCLDIPCGRCLSCRMDYARQWADRLSLESTYWKNAYFITLTYSDEFVGDYCLKKRDAQLFLMRLQKHFPGSKYFLCGEYGSRTLRPHYHLIFFTNDDIQLGDQLGPNRWDSPEISRIWSYFDKRTKVSYPIGIVEISMANPACMGYVAQYCQDKQSKEDPLGRPPKFLLMSKRPAIGFQYLHEHACRFLHDLNCYGPNGLVIPMPKAFSKKLDNDVIKTKRQAMAVKAAHNADTVYLTTDKCSQGFVKRTLAENKLKKQKRSDL